MAQRRAPRPRRCRSRKCQTLGVPRESRELTQGQLQMIPGGAVVGFTPSSGNPAGKSSSLAEKTGGAAVAGHPPESVKIRKMPAKRLQASLSRSLAPFLAP